MSPDARNVTATNVAGMMGASCSEAALIESSAKRFTWNVMSGCPWPSRQSISIRVDTQSVPTTRVTYTADFVDCIFRGESCAMINQMARDETSQSSPKTVPDRKRHSIMVENTHSATREATGCPCASPYVICRTVILRFDSS